MVVALLGHYYDWFREISPPCNCADTTRISRNMAVSGTNRASILHGQYGFVNNILKDESILGLAQLSNHIRNLL